MYGIVCQRRRSSLSLSLSQARIVSGLFLEHCSGGGEGVFAIHHFR